MFVTIAKIFKSDINKVFNKIYVTIELDSTKVYDY
jgi:hypothetical protein